jgi:hypothetical protein
MMPWLKLDPAWLPPGTQVGPWKVLGFHGGGSFGAVFRAVLTRRPHGGLVALKLAYSPADARFQREAELLSRIEHPNVPRLLGRGAWQHPGGAAYPYLAMEWVEGLPLYEWAARANPSSQQVLRVLVQVAQALEATHAVGGVHRDVKGANILVNLTDSRAFLMDYGAGNYAGAEPLTRDGLPPGTEQYRSPEAWEFELHRPRNSPAVYKAQPADDMFALGVSAYRCVTGTYLPPLDVREEQTGPSSLVWTPPRAPRELNPQVEPGLSALILRLLSRQPEQRPTQHELAEAFEHATRNPAPGQEPRPVEPRPPASPAAEAPGQQPSPAREQARAHAMWFLAPVRVPAWVAAYAVLVGALIAVALGWALGTGRQTPAHEQLLPAPAPVGMGDTSLTAPVAMEEAPSARKSLGRSIPLEPFDGQRRAPHCQPPEEVTINGGCWIELPTMKPPCRSLSYEWKGRCYVPHIPPGRAPTSEPP